MTKQVFVLTEEHSHRLIGVYSHYGRAVNAMFTNALGYTITGIEPQPVGTAYQFKTANGDRSEFFIENAFVDDTLWLGAIHKEDDEE